MFNFTNCWVIFSPTAWMILLGGMITWHDCKKCPPQITMSTTNSTKNGISSHTLRQLFSLTNRIWGKIHGGMLCGTKIPFNWKKLPGWHPKLLGIGPVRNLQLGGMVISGFFRSSWYILFQRIYTWHANTKGTKCFETSTYDDWISSPARAMAQDAVSCYGNTLSNDSPQPSSMNHWKISFPPIFTLL